MRKENVWRQNAKHCDLSALQIRYQLSQVELNIFIKMLDTRVASLNLPCFSFDSYIGDGWQNIF